VRGSGNVFRDLGRVSASGEQARAILAAEIIRTMDRINSRLAPSVLNRVLTRLNEPLT
jgi:hypothetical protein